jgi:hypothetical protein
VHSLTKAIFELLAGCTNSFASPVAIPIVFKAFFPNLVKIIAIDIPLPKNLSIYVRTGADSSIYQNGADIDTCMAEVRGRTHLLLIAAKIALTAECYLHRSRC